MIFQIFHSYVELPEGKCPKDSHGLGDLYITIYFEHHWNKYPLEIIFYIPNINMLGDVQVGHLPTPEKKQPNDGRSAAESYGIQKP